MMAGSPRKRPTRRSALTRERLWIIDPIDGTRAFIEGREEWCVAAALAIAAARFSPPSTAPGATNSTRRSLGEGAQLNGAPAHHPRFGGSRTAPSSRATARRSPAWRLWESQPDTSGSLPLQLRLAYVAAGRIDGAVSVGKRHDWDLAAGELLVLEAGGAVSGVSGEGYIYNRPEPWQQGLVAAGAKRHAAL